MALVIFSRYFFSQSSDFRMAMKQVSHSLATSVDVKVVDLTKSPIPVIDLTITDSCHPKFHPKLADLPHLAPPHFLKLPTSQEMAHRNDEKITAFVLDPPPFYLHPSQSDQVYLVKEAKSMNDSDFEFLWAYQQEMHEFAATAGGRTTRLRTLSNK